MHNIQENETFEVNILNELLMTKERNFSGKWCENFPIERYDH